MDHATAKQLLEENYNRAEWKEATSASIYSTTRWSVFYEQIWHSLVDDKYYRVTWSRGATEYQDEDNENIDFYEVRPVTVSVVDYVAV